MSSASPPHDNAASGPLRAASTRIGEKYRSLHVVGRGGMGLVEVALERGDGGRVVALKRLLPEGAKDRRLSDMFLREARLARMLSHPNVVHAFDFGEVDGELFLAMEYVEGEPLSRVLAAIKETATQGRGPHEAESPIESRAALDPVLAAYLLAEICVGLHAAHDLTDEKGTMLNVVHRDVSPHNVMLAYDGRIKLLDFGVAKSDAEGGLTRTGEVKGKVAYMSPEQAMSDALDRRSDLYSIGAVLFECIAGRRMWLGTDMEVLRQLALDLPPKLEDFAPNVPRELCVLYTRLVSRDPRGRPASAAVVADELRSFVARANPNVGPGAIEALMARLFAGAAAKRREELARAIEAGPDASSLAESPDVPSVAATVSGARARIDAEARPKSRKVAASGIVAGIVLLGIGGAVALSRSHAPPEAVIAASPSASAASTSTPAASAPAVSSVVVALPPAAAPVSPPSTRINSPKPNPASHPASGRPRPPSVTPKPAPTTPLAPKHIDVDPDPI